MKITLKILEAFRISITNIENAENSEELEKAHRTIVDWIRSLELGLELKTEWFDLRNRSKQEMTSKAQEILDLLMLQFSK